MSTITPHATATGVARYKKNLGTRLAFYSGSMERQTRQKYDCRLPIVDLRFDWRCSIRLSITDCRSSIRLAICDSIVDYRLSIFDSIVDLRSDCRFLSVDLRFDCRFSISCLPIAIRSVSTNRRFTFQCTHARHVV